MAPDRLDLPPVVENMIAPELFLFGWNGLRAAVLEVSRSWIEDYGLDRMVGFGCLGIGAVARQPTHVVARAFRQNYPFENRLVQTRLAKNAFR